MGYYGLHFACSKGFSKLVDFFIDEAQIFRKDPKYFHIKTNGVFFSCLFFFFFFLFFFFFSFFFFFFLFFSFFFFFFFSFFSLKF